ncbi:CLUMA_CG014900, isoform A [Clunio marinus]|uniref:CLUMA_CG014900, isoform A n=1 Tax=Clunio marinus TaxID=568069 RepID=A0A1J1IT49_9DIPT|nr:CLUMA_CG014900, isoform A [Clunio marinus]
MKSKKFVILFLSIVCESLSKPTEHDDRMMLRKRMDLSDAGASYVYRSDNNGPIQVYYLSAGDLGQTFNHQALPLISYEPLTATPYHYQKPFTAFQASPAPIAEYHHVHSEQPTYETGFKPIIPYNTNNFVPIPPPILRSSPVEKSLPVIKVKPIIEEIKEEESNDDDSDDEIDQDEIVQDEAQPKIDSLSHEDSFSHSGEDISRSFDSHDNDDHLSESAQSHEDKYKKNHGKKSKEGYSKEENFKKGKKGSYHKDHKEGDESEEGESEKSHYDEADKHQEYSSKDKKEKGGQYKKQKHHKKGSQSKGYHNVFMKDEYKKDHTFYDTADHHGHYSKHGANHKEHESDDGHKEKGSHYDSKFKEGHNSKKGGTDEGHYEKEDEGHKKKSGHSEKHSDHEKYAKEGSKDKKNHHGYKHE